MFGLGSQELLVIAVISLLLAGPRLPRAAPLRWARRSGVQESTTRRIEALMLARQQQRVALYIEPDVIEREVGVLDPLTNDRPLV